MTSHSRYIVKDKYEKYANWMLFLYLSESFLIPLSRFVFTKIGIYEGSALREILIFIISAVPLAMFLFRMSKFPVIRYKQFLFLIIIVLIYIFGTLYFDPDKEYFIMREDYGIPRIFKPSGAIYAYLFFRLVDNPKDILFIVKRFAYLEMFFIVLIQLLPAISRGYWMDIDYDGNTIKRNYSLSFGYQMLLPSIIFLYFFIKEKKIHLLAISLFGFMTILLYGSRGALMMPVIFIALIIVSNIANSKSTQSKIKKIILVIILTIVIIFLGKILIESFVLWLTSSGVHSRTLESFISGNITDDSGRSYIWNAVKKAISEGGWFGYGFFGDRPFVFPLHYAAYSHNIFLEIICNFGIIGVIIICYLLYGSAKMVLKCKNQEYRDLFIIFFSVSCELLLSLSFWYVMEFWGAIALAQSYFYKQKTLKKKKVLSESYIRPTSE